MERGQPHRPRDVRKHAQRPTAAQWSDERRHCERSPLGRILMEKLPLFSLPCPSTAPVHGPTLVDEDRGLLLSLVCDDDGHERQAEILFVKPRAFRKRGEIYCTGWHVKGPCNSKFRESKKKRKPAWGTDLRRARCAVLTACRSRPRFISCGSACRPRSKPSSSRLLR